MYIKRIFLAAFALLFAAGFCLAQPVNIDPRTQCPPITPAWAFGHIVWEDNVNTTQGAEDLVNGYLDRRIPVDAVIIDSPWSTTYNDFEWDSARYADPSAMIRGFQQKGVRTILWLTGFVNEQGKDTRLQKSATFDEVVSRGYAVNGGKSVNWWKGRGVHIDFTNAEAVQWWNSQLDKVFTDGVYGWKVDQSDYDLPPFFETSKGTMANEAFRHYYYDAMYDYTVARKDEGITIARPYSHQGGLASRVEKANMGWCGDFSGTWTGLCHQINDIYRSSRYGFGAVGCEVGGFHNPPSNAKQLLRYAQFGCMTACMINGGMNGAFTAHLPWTHGAEIEAAYRWCVQWMKSLAPYKFSAVVDAHLHGGSLIRETNLEERSHLLGTDIFTKAIVSDSDEVTFHLPENGEWIDYWTGETVPGGTKLTRTYPVDRFPLFIRSGAIIPQTDPSMPGKRIIRIYPNGRTLRRFHLPKGEGTAYFECRVCYDQKTGKMMLDSDEPADFVIIVGKKQVAVSGAHIEKKIR